jgi:hypothetical protein
MKIRIHVEKKPVCDIQLLNDKAPNLCRQLVAALPLSGRITHAKLSGPVIFFTLPFIAPWENYMLFEEVPRHRQGNTSRGAVCINNAAQHFCVAYAHDVVPEPLGMSYIGDVVEGLERLENIGIRSWLHQGYRIELSLLP